MIRRALVALCLPLLLLTAPSAHASIPPHYRLGGLDLTAYCQSQGDRYAELDGATAYDWHCVTPEDGRSGIAFDAACRGQYGSDKTVDRIENFYDPASVSCWRVAATSYFHPDFSAFCRQARHHDGALLTGPTVYDWHCADQGPAGPVLTAVDVPAVCDWASGGYHAFDRFADFYEPDSWQCLL